MLHPVFRIVLDDAHTRLHVDMIVVGLQAEDHAIKLVLLDRDEKLLHQLIRRPCPIGPLDERFERNQHSPQAPRSPPLFEGI